MASSEVSIGGAVRFAWAVLRDHGRAIWGVLALNALAVTVSVAGDFGMNPALFFGGMLVQAVTNVMVLGAVFRLTLADRHAGDPVFAPRALGLQWTSMETRMLAATLLLALLLIFISVLVLLAVAAVIMGVLQAQGVPATAIQTPQGMGQALGPAAGLIFVVLFGAFAYVSLRLSLIAPATADQGAIRIFRTWKTTRGQWWRILLAGVVILLPLLILANLLTMPLLGGDPVATLQSSMMGLKGAAGARTAVALSPPAAFGAALISGVAMGAIAAPLQAGALAYFYRNLADRTAA